LERLAQGSYKRLTDQQESEETEGRHEPQRRGHPERGRVAWLPANADPNVLAVVPEWDPRAVLDARRNGHSGRTLFLDLARAAALLARSGQAARAAAAGAERDDSLTRARDS